MVMVPTIPGCGTQKYSYVPGWSKVYENRPPAAIAPESNAPFRAVQVWATTSLFTTVTVSPTLPVVAPEYWNPAMVIVNWRPAGGAVVVGAWVVVVDAAVVVVVVVGAVVVVVDWVVGVVVTVVGTAVEVVVSGAVVVVDDSAVVVDGVSMVVVVSAEVPLEHATRVTTSRLMSRRCGRRDIRRGR